MRGKNTRKSDNDLFITLDMNGSNPSFMDNEKKKIRTDDFGLAVILFHTGAKLLSVNKENTNKLIFIFKKIINLQNITDEFYSDMFDVKAFSFLESIKSFKKLIDSEQKINNNSKK